MLSSGHLLRGPEREWWADFDESRTAMCRCTGSCCEWTVGGSPESSRTACSGWSDRARSWQCIPYCEPRASHCHSWRSECAGKRAGCRQKGALDGRNWSHPDIIHPQERTDHCLEDCLHARLSGLCIHGAIRNSEQRIPKEALATWPEEGLGGIRSWHREHACHWATDYSLINWLIVLTACRAVVLAMDSPRYLCMFWWTAASSVFARFACRFLIHPWRTPSGCAHSLCNPCLVLQLLCRQIWKQVHPVHLEKTGSSASTHAWWNRKVCSPMPLRMSLWHVCARWCWRLDSRL